MGEWESKQELNNACMNMYSNGVYGVVWPNRNLNERIDFVHYINRPYKAVLHFILYKPWPNRANYRVAALLIVVSLYAFVYVCVIHNNVKRQYIGPSKATRSTKTGSAVCISVLHMATVSACVFVCVSVMFACLYVCVCLALCTCTSINYANTQKVIKSETQ